MDQQTRNELAAGGTGLLDLGGRTFVVSPPTDSDFATLAGELRRLAKRRVRSPLAAVAEELAALPAEYRRMALEAASAIAAAGPVEPTQDQVGAMLYEPEGCRFWLWQLARRNHPGLTLEELKGVVTADNVTEVLAGLSSATKVDRLGKSTGRAG